MREEDIENMAAGGGERKPRGKTRARPRRDSTRPREKERVYIYRGCERGKERERARSGGLDRDEFVSFHAGKLSRSPRVR